MQKTLVTFSFTLLLGEGTRYSKTLEKRERVLDSTKPLRNAERIEK